MTLIRNERPLRELRMRPRRMGWWRWSDTAPPHGRGVRCEHIALDTLRPITPCFMVEGRNYTEGEFLGWVDEVTREEAMACLK